jgi:hypothetical protein
MVKHSRRKLTSRLVSKRGKSLPADIPELAMHSKVDEVVGGCRKSSPGVSLVHNGAPDGLSRVVDVSLVVSVHPGGAQQGCRVARDMPAKQNAFNGGLSWPTHRHSPTASR